MSEKEKLQDCFVNAFGSGAKNGLETISLGMEFWDSVAHIALVTEMEAVFGVELSPEEVTELTTFSAAQQILARHGISFAS